MSEPTATSDAAPVAPAIEAIDTLAAYREHREALIAEPAEAAAPVEAVAEAAEPTAEEKAQQDRDEQGRFKPKGDKKDPQARINHLTWEREEARREAAEMRQRLEALERGQQRPQEAQAPAQAAPQAQGDPEPQEADFDNYAAFVKAQARWEARAALREEREAAQHRHVAAQREQTHQQRATQFQERMGAASQADPEFLSTLSPDVLHLQPSTMLERGQRATGANVIADVVLEAENPAGLMRHLSAHQDDFRRIAALHPLAALKEMAKIEARLEAAPAGPAPKAPPVSSAKPPIKPVGSDATVPSGTRDPRQINSVSEWRAVRDRVAGGRG